MNNLRPAKDVNFKREIEIILQSIRIPLDPEYARRLGILLESRIDWDFLFGTASRHAVLPLVYQRLRNLKASDISGPLEEVQGHLQGNTFWNLLLTRELLTLLAYFASHNVVAVPFKGPVLAVAAYGDLALRQFNDLDILVKKSDVLKAKELLLALGYQPEMELSPEEEVALLEHQFHYAFLNKEENFLLEVHWEVSAKYISFPLDYQNLWARLESQTLLGRQVLTFTPEDTFLILCVHGAKHCWGRLSWIVDLAALIAAHPHLDWGQVMSQATKLNSRRMVLLGLFLGKHLGGATLPFDLERLLEHDRVVAGLAQLVMEQLSGQAPGRLQNFKIIYFHLRLHEHLADKVRYILQIAFAPNLEDLTRPMPAGLSFIYGFLRPLRLLRNRLASPD